MNSCTIMTNKDDHFIVLTSAIPDAIQRDTCYLYIPEVTPNAITLVEVYLNTLLDHGWPRSVRAIGIPDELTIKPELYNIDLLEQKELSYFYKIGERDSVYPLINPKLKRILHGKTIVNMLEHTMVHVSRQIRSKPEALIGHHSNIGRLVNVWFDRLLITWNWVERPELQYLCLPDGTIKATVFIYGRGMITEIAAYLEVSGKELVIKQLTYNF